jgi:hypothetical protein
MLSVAKDYPVSRMNIYLDDNNIQNKVVATESSTSNQEDPCKEVNREIQG